MSGSLMPRALQSDLLTPPESTARSTVSRRPKRSGAAEPSTGRMTQLQARQLTVASSGSCCGSSHRRSCCSSSAPLPVRRCSTTPTDGAIILAIVAASGLLGFWQEYNAANIVAALLSKVELKATVMRDGREAQVPVSAVVPGDVVCVSAGSSIPADCRLLASRDLFVNEAALTGESFPVDKCEGQLAADTPLGRRTNALFMGTHAVSGTGRPWWCRPVSGPSSG